MALGRGVRFVFTLIGLAVFMSFAGLLVLYALVSQGPSVPDDATLVLRPGGDLQEIAPDTVVEQLINRDAATIRGLVENLRKAKRDPRITNVLLVPSTISPRRTTVSLLPVKTRIAALLPVTETKPLTPGGTVTLTLFVMFSAP